MSSGDAFRILKGWFETWLDVDWREDNLEEFICCDVDVVVAVVEVEAPPIAGGATISNALGSILYLVLRPDMEISEM